MIPEPQNPKPRSSEKFGPLPFRFGFLRVLAAIEFDYQPALQATEVRDVRPHAMLAAELHSREAPRAQPEPELVFRLGLIAAQKSRAPKR